MMKKKIVKPPIAVPVVASFPDKEDVLANRKKCVEMGYNVYLDPVLRLNPKINRRLPDVEFGDPCDRSCNLKRLIGEKLRKNEFGIIATATGGLGTARTLSKLDGWMDLFRMKVCVGFSDSTLLCNFAAMYSDGYPSFHGPCFEDMEFVDALPFYAGDKRSWTTRVTYVDGTFVKCRGEVWGGNLTLLGYLLSNSAFLNRVASWKSPILFLEDIYEKRIYGTAKVKMLLEMEFDRLEHAGVFKNTQLVLMGRVSDINSAEVRKSLRKYYSGPIVGLDLGHDFKNKKASLLPVIPIGVDTVLQMVGASNKHLECQWVFPGRE